jgi:uncharacterized membrane protein YoaK (UPF0700 family)
MLRGGRGRAGPADLTAWEGGEGGEETVPATDDADGQAAGPDPAAALRNQRDATMITALAVVLTLGTGATDVASFTRLGGVFASVMTGNLVLLGLAIGRSAALATHAVVAFAGYAAGVAASTRLIRVVPAMGSLHRPLRATLLAEFALLAGFAAGWELTGGAPRGAAQMALLAVATAAMGTQSTAARGLGPQVSTTYLTGTLTGFVAAWVTPGRQARLQSREVLVLAALTAGAAAGGLVIANAAAGLPAIPLTALALATGASWTWDRRAGQPDARA